MNHRSRARAYPCPEANPTVGLGFETQLAPFSSDVDTTMRLPIPLLELGTGYHPGGNADPLPALSGSPFLRPCDAVAGRVLAPPADSPDSAKRVNVASRLWRRVPDSGQTPSCSPAGSGPVCTTARLPSA